MCGRAVSWTKPGVWRPIGVQLDCPAALWKRRSGDEARAAVRVLLEMRRGADGLAHEGASPDMATARVNGGGAGRWGWSSARGAAPSRSSSSAPGPACRSRRTRPGRHALHHAGPVAPLPLRALRTARKLRGAQECRLLRTLDGAEADGWGRTGPRVGGCSVESRLYGRLGMHFVGGA